MIVYPFSSVSCGDVILTGAAGRPWSG